MILTCLPNKFAGLHALLGSSCRQLQNVSLDEMLVCVSRVLVVVQIHPYIMIIAISANFH